jgi:hypothetical protein
MPGDVLEWLGLQDATEETQSRFVDCVLAADAHIRAYVTVPVDDDDEEVVPADLKLAAIMWAARISKRATNPEGSTITDFGVVRVNRWDADIEALLAPYRTWTGFA